MKVYRQSVVASVPSSFDIQCHRLKEYIFLFLAFSIIIMKVWAVSGSISTINRSTV